MGEAAIDGCMDGWSEGGIKRMEMGEQYVHVNALAKQQEGRTRAVSTSPPLRDVLRGLV